MDGVTIAEFCEGIAPQMPDQPLRLFLAGDVMTGRGVDQILTRPSPALLHEPYVNDAREYVRLAEAASGPVPRCVDPSHIWGDALEQWERMAPAARIANLETAVTRSDDYCRSKSIHYRMHPDNIACIRAARFDVCVLANNHVLDFGCDGLVETLQTLKDAGIRTAGAGRNLDEARRTVVLSLPTGGRLLITACGHESAGIPDDWAALTSDPGIDLLPELSEDAAAAVAGRVTAERRAGDVAIVSIHWGDNWGYEVPRRHAAIAHRLVERGVDIVHGHSSHHPRPIEVYRDRLILYGCGDFIDDYEGISGYERYRDDLVLMFFPSLNPATGELVALEMAPMQVRNIRLNRVSTENARWLCDTLNRVSRPFNAGVMLTADGSLRLEGSGCRAAS
jgi:poly-gamma-glutamate synthesis protein (capsule biosynthesis protein)